MNEDRVDLVVLTRAQLETLLHRVVELYVTASPTPREPELVDGTEMCRLITVSRTTLHRLRLRGMPAIPVGDTFRYRPAAVLAWLEAQGAGTGESPPR